MKYVITRRNGDVETRRLEKGSKLLGLRIDSIILDSMSDLEELQQYVQTETGLRWLYHLRLAMKNI